MFHIVITADNSQWFQTETESTELMQKSDTDWDLPGEALASALARARQYSPFLRKALATHTDLAKRLEAGDFPAALAIEDRCDRASSADDVLRQWRDRHALVTAIGDLSGGWDFTQTVSWLSQFADKSVGRALDVAFEEQFPGEAPRGFAVIALGKLGSRELNYSSDIDIMLLFDPGRLPGAAGDTAEKSALRLSRRLLELLQDRTPSGYVFRVDLRLRPAPEATPIALAVDPAISHYETSAEPWERAAFIRARHLAGDTAVSDRFLTAIEPFVWRRALDFGAIREVRGVSLRIRDHYAQVVEFGPGYDLKRGRGGIREIEFYAQIHQLILGGRQPELRAPATLDALAALAAAGVIAEADRETLAGGYRLLRTIEHRVQMIDDRQTHQLPKNREALDNVARLHGLDDGGALLGLLDKPVAAISALYDDLEEDGGERLPSDGQLLEDRLAALGIAEAVDARRRIEGWRDGARVTTRSPAAREALEAILPQLVADIAAAPDPIGVFNRLDTLLAKLPSALNIFRLIEARPGLGGALVAILSHSPALADALARRAELFDTLIDASALEPPEPVDELEQLLRERGRADSYQQLLDAMRRLVGEERFALGVQLIEGTSDPLEVATGYARVAEAALRILADAAIAEFARDHGTVPGSDFAILGLGRLGGGALTHASDLDLVYLFSGDHAAESDGERPLGATRYYQRLAQRVTAALSAPTAAGALYEVDTRLRPSGNQGLLAVSIDSFEAYQRESAWTWEHMALARARPVYGPPDVQARLRAIIDAILRRPRDPARTMADAVSMRAEMAAHKPPAGSLDVKLAPGGLVDLEFCVHANQLIHGAGLSCDLSQAIAGQMAAGLLPEGTDAAHRLLTRMLVALRLIAPASVDVPQASRGLVAERCGAADWEALMTQYEAARRTVSDIWQTMTHGVGKGDET